MENDLISDFSTVAHPGKERFPYGHRKYHTHGVDNS